MTNSTDFSHDIRKEFSEVWDINQEPRYTTLCAIKKLIRDNLVLIVGGILAFGFLTYTISSLIVRVINKYKARGIYKQIEKDLKEQSEAYESDNYEIGMTVPDIIKKYRKNKSEANFEKNILPHLENYRRGGKKIVVFSKTVNARQVDLWQYK